MIAETSSWSFVFRLLAPLVWRSERKIAGKLLGFAATEAGSALDMLKAAELATDPRLRRLYFRHAMDEARHAQMFRHMARSLEPRDVSSDEDAYRLIHATRQNLYETYGEMRFVAFVHLAERRGEVQFRALERHFALRRPDLESLFARIGKDERFHIAYSGRILEEWRRQGRAAEVRRALLRVRLSRAAQAWRNSGRIMGDALSRLLLVVLYLTLLPLFALIERRRARKERGGWKSCTRRQLDLAWARRQSS
jgi:rubrerythrin